MPVRVIVSTVVVKSGIASFRAHAFCVPIVAASNAIATYVVTARETRRGNHDQHDGGEHRLAGDARREQPWTVPAQANDEPADEERSDKKRSQGDERAPDAQSRRAGGREAEEDDVAGHVRHEDVTETQITDRIDDPGCDRQQQQELRKGSRRGAEGGHVYSLSLHIVTVVEAYLGAPFSAV